MEGPKMDLERVLRQSLWNCGVEFSRPHPLQIYYIKARSFDFWRNDYLGKIYNWRLPLSLGISRHYGVKLHCEVTSPQKLACIHYLLQIYCGKCIAIILRWVLTAARRRENAIANLNSENSWRGDFICSQVFLHVLYMNWYVEGKSEIKWSYKNLPHWWCRHTEMHRFNLHF